MQAPPPLPGSIPIIPKPLDIRYDPQPQGQKPVALKVEGSRLLPCEPTEMWSLPPHPPGSATSQADHYQGGCLSVYLYA